jgi:hypothetical protein
MIIAQQKQYFRLIQMGSSEGLQNIALTPRGKNLECQQINLLFDDILSLSITLGN